MINYLMELEKLQTDLSKALEENNKEDIGNIYNKIGDYFKEINGNNMLKYYLKAVKYNHVNAMYKLGVYYKAINDIPNMIKYYLMAIDNNNTNAMHSLALYYESINEIPNMIKYYLMAIEHNNIGSMINLGNYYKKINDIPNMIKYYLMAIEHNHTDAMYNLGIYYKEINDIPNMVKYYLMAIEHNHVNAMYNLGIFYSEINDIPNMIKYYLMAIDNSEDYYLLPYIFKNLDYIDYNKMIEIVNIIKKKNIKNYNDKILKIIVKFSFEEQLNIKNILDIKTKKDIDIDLKIKNASRDTECIVCLEEKKCIPYSWCFHYLCINCIYRCIKCPYCRHE